METRIDDDVASHPARLRSRPRGRDRACAVGARNAGEFQAGILPKLDPDVPVVERGGVDLDQGFARSRHRLGHFGPDQLVNPGELDGQHGRQLFVTTSCRRKRTLGVAAYLSSAAR